MNKASYCNAVCTAVLLCATAIALPAQTLTTLVTFNDTNGRAPWTLIQGADGNFYGTTSSGGVHSYGTIFKMTPGGTLTTLYSFCSLLSCADGWGPAAGLIQGSDGNFYGTTSGGGANGNYGTVFKFTPGGTETTLYSFCPQAGCADGSLPYGALIQATDGNLYGTTYDGGASNLGTVFKITLGGTLTTLHSFAGADGSSPYPALIQGNDGNLYGTTALGGAKSNGTVFKITPSGALTTLYSFCSQSGCADGLGPVARLIQASDGNFYGTTLLGGANDAGTAFKITSGGVLTTLYSFCAQTGCTDGEVPYAGLMQASDGNLYGATTGNGVSSDGAGTLFRITLGGKITTLTTFCTECFEDEGSLAALIQGTDGNLYGTTALGGPNGDGTIFKLIPAAATAEPAINQTGGIVSGASFLPGFAPGSWITIYGTNLSPVTGTWANSIVNGVLPISLDGVSVSVGGVPAYIAYVSPTQINALAPSGYTGTQPVTVTSSGETSAAIDAVVEPAAPAFFQWPGNYAVATKQDYSYAVKNGTFSGLTTTPAKPGDVITLWGTGFGPTNPSAPSGFETPSTTVYNTASPVTVTVGGVPATVYGAALAPGDAGLYQVAIQIPTSLANGDYAVIATIYGAQSPSTTLITVQM